MSWELVLASSVHSRITMVTVLLFYSYHIAALPLARHCFHRVVSRRVESRNVRKINFIHIWLWQANSENSQMLKGLIKLPLKSPQTVKWETTTTQSLSHVMNFEFCISLHFLMEKSEISPVHLQHSCSHAVTCSLRFRNNRSLFLLGQRHFKERQSIGCWFNARCWHTGATGDYSVRRCFLSGWARQ